MEFKITEEEAFEMARFEEEVGCDISAGPDWGVHLGSVMALALNQVDRAKSRGTVTRAVGKCTVTVRNRGSVCKRSSAVTRTGG